MNYDDALATVTANVADIFHLDSGRIAVGKSADLVLWSGDPFEFSSRCKRCGLQERSKAQTVVKTSFVTAICIKRQCLKPIADNISLFTWDVSLNR